MDQLPTNLPTPDRFTAEQVRKFLGLNNDYSNSSSSSSSDCENDNFSDISLDINTNESQSDEKKIIPPSPKRGKMTENKSVQNWRQYPTRSPRTLCRAVFLFLCILNVVVIFYYIFINVQLPWLLHSIGPSP